MGMNIHRIEQEFEIGDALVDRFATLTGDRSALHCDDGFARRTRFRERPAHGMLAVISLAALTGLESEPGGVRLQAIKGHFREPIRIPDRLVLRIEVESEDDSRRFSATWTRAGQAGVLAVASGRYRPGPPSAPGPAGSQPPATPRFDQLDPVLETLEGHSETLRFMVDPGLLSRFASEILQPMGLASACVVSPELLAVMMLSPMSGMHLPGRRGATLRFSLDFERDIEVGQACALTGTVRRVQLDAGHIATDVALAAAGAPVASGSLEALLMDRPVAMPGAAELRETYLERGLRGRVALVVGGSRGIGEVTAKFLALEGAFVALTYYRGAADAEAIVAEIRAAGGAAACFACDVRCADQVKSLVGAVVDRFGGIDILVNAFAGRFDPSPAIANHWDDYLEELEISVKGVHEVCAAAVPVMQKRGGGKIVNFSAMAARNPVSGQSRYATARGAVEAYTRNLAKELIRSNIQVNLVVPNMTDTDLLACLPRTFRDRLADSREYGRHVHPAEAAQAVAFLASQWSNAITGQSVVINLGEAPFG